MKIRTRMLFLNIIFLIAILGTVAAAFTLFQYRGNIQSLILEMRSVVAQMYRTNSFSKDLLIENDLERNYESFKRQYFTFRTQTLDLLDSETFKRLIESSEENREGSDFVRNLIREADNRVETLDEHLEEIFARYQQMAIPGFIQASISLKDSDILFAKMEAESLTLFLG